MAKFTDRFGNEWEIAITAGDLTRIRHDVGVDLRDALRSDGGKLLQVLTDNDKFLDLMWCVCSRQYRSPERGFVGWLGDGVRFLFGRRAKKRRAEFAYLFDHDTVVGAVAAVWEAIWSFTHGQRNAMEARNALLASKEKLENGTLRLLQSATRQIKAAGPISNASVNGSAESPASTTDPSPSPN